MTMKLCGSGLVLLGSLPTGLGLLQLSPQAEAVGLLGLGLLWLGAGLFALGSLEQFLAGRTGRRPEREE